MEVQSGREGLLTTAELAARRDFALGDATVRPSTRTVHGPGGETDVEPRVMQVLVVLADAEGSVVTREKLFHRCWGTRLAGDDSLNRAIAGVRRIALGPAGGSFEIETVPRTGYQLIVKRGARPGGTEHEGAPGSTEGGRFTRRSAAAGLAAATAAAGFGLWALSRERRDPRVAQLIERGREALRYGSPTREQGVEYFRQAVALAPSDAEAWGYLAVAYRNVAENASPEQTAAAVQATEQAARRALTLDEREGNALAALATIRPFFGDWLPAEQRIKRVFALAPDNFTALTEITLLLQAAGYSRESWNWNERAVAVEPLSPLPQYKRALKHWIFGRLARADHTIDQSLQLWPRHPAVWNARLMLFAFTGRPNAALTFMADARARPPTFTDATLAFWRPSLTALETRLPADIAIARATNLEYAPRSPGFSVWAIMVMSALGELDQAFEIAGGYLLRRGPLVGSLWTGSGQMPVNDHRWRRTMNLFTPASATMRADPRFLQLCDGIGLTDYWGKRGIKPDYQLGLA